MSSMQSAWRQTPRLRRRYIHTVLEHSHDLWRSLGVFDGYHRDHSPFIFPISILTLKSPDLAKKKSIKLAHWSSLSLPQAIFPRCHLHENSSDVRSSGCDIRRIFFSCGSLGKTNSCTIKLRHDSPLSKISTLGQFNDTVTRREIWNQVRIYLSG